MPCQFDIIVLLVLAVGFVAGVFKGFVKQFVSIVCLVASIAVARAAAPFLAGFFDEDYRNVAYGASFALVMVAVFIAGALVSAGLKSLLLAVNLGWLNRLAGGVLCAFKYLVLTGVAVSLVEIFGAKDRVFPEGVEKSSFFYEASKNSLGTLMPFVDTVSKAANDLVETGLGTSAEK